MALLIAVAGCSLHARAHAKPMKNGIAHGMQNNRPVEAHEVARDTLRIIPTPYMAKNHGVDIFSNNHTASIIANTTQLIISTVEEVPLSMPSAILTVHINIEGAMGHNPRHQGFTGSWYIHQKAVQATNRWSDHSFDACKITWHAQEDATARTINNHAAEASAMSSGSTPTTCRRPNNVVRYRKTRDQVINVHRIESSTRVVRILHTETINTELWKQNAAPRGSNAATSENDNAH